MNYLIEFDAQNIQKNFTYICIRPLKKECGKKMPRTKNINITFIYIRVCQESKIFENQKWVSSFLCEIRQTLPEHEYYFSNSSDISLIYLKTLYNMSPKKAKI